MDTGCGLIFEDEFRILFVAAYQAPLLPSGSMESLDLIRRQVDLCESEDVEILCCPAAILVVPARDNVTISEGGCDQTDT